MQWKNCFAITPEMTKSKTSQSFDSTTSSPITLSKIRENAQLWYKIHVLLYDLRNIKTDPSSSTRTLSTTDELYISSPYFTSSEALLVKSAIITNSDVIINSDNTVTVEEFIKTQLENFFEKRRASGDARPCGPHDLAPIYERAFGIERAAMKDERFLARLRRSGLGDGNEISKNATDSRVAGKKEERQE